MKENEMIHSAQSASSIQNCLWLCQLGLRQFFKARERSRRVQNSKFKIDFRNSL